MNQSEVEAGYRKLLDEKRKYLKELYPLDSKHTWQEDACDKGITIHSQFDPNTGLKIIRANIKINAPPANVIEAGEQPEVILAWDKTLEDIKIVRKIKEFYIFYVLIKKLPLVDQRESVLLAKLYYEDDGTIEGVSCSIDYPDIPKSENKVRSTAYLVGIVAKPEPDDPNKTDYTYILHASPEGLIPVALYNWFVNGQGFNLRPFTDYMEEEWKKEMEKKSKVKDVKKIEDKKEGRENEANKKFKKEEKETEMLVE